MQIWQCKNRQTAVVKINKPAKIKRKHKIMIKKMKLTLQESRRNRHKLKIMLVRFMKCKNRIKSNAWRLASPKKYNQIR